MGRTYYKTSKNFDELNFGKHLGKPAKHASGKKTSGMRMLNNYVETDYDLDNDTFNDDVDLKDNISIQHNTNTK